MALDIVFMGTPDFAVPVLDAILAAGHRLVAVYSQPPRPSGRGMAEQPSPVQRYALQKGLKIITPFDVKAQDARSACALHASDALWVVD